MTRTNVEVRNEDGRSVKYDGVLVGELLKRAGVTLGSDMRGNALTTYVLASASDGYQLLFSLAELDPAFTSSDIIVADTIDGKPLFGNQGQFRIVSPKDARPARSIRMLQRLDVVRLKSSDDGVGYGGMPRWEGSMTLSARNHPKGTIEEIQLGDVPAHVTVRVEEGVIESVITRRSAEEMVLKRTQLE